MRRFCSILNQLLQIFPRAEFQKAVEETNAERHARGFRSWDQFVAMLFSHLADANSLREICGGLATCETRLGHLGVRAPLRTTLAYANGHRNWELYEKVFYQLLEYCRRDVGTKTRFKFKNPLKSIDSTHISLCSEMFPWATYSRQKGALKLHFSLDHAGYLPSAMVIATGKISELAIARRQRWEEATILLFDRGYIDFKWFNRLTSDGVWFITRVRADMTYDVIESAQFQQNGEVIADEKVRICGRRRSKRYPGLLRVVTIQKTDGERFQFLTNNMTLAASTIAAAYKDRWQIESFFRVLKQNLRIKSFLSTSPNAVWTQIWTAVIAMLLVRYLQLKARYNWSFSNLLYFLRMNLFVYRDLWEWLQEPFSPPPPGEPVSQLVLQWN
ncbi:MAG TPA: IS4 family transposase [Pirellula sp.]|nr:IS4 family transposase [Pirellula sp.]